MSEPGYVLKFTQFKIKEFFLPLPINLDFKKVKEFTILPKNGEFYLECSYDIDPVSVRLDLNQATNEGKSYWAKDGRKTRIAQNQDWRCPICGEYLFNGEATEIHHKIQVKDGGTDELKNLVHVHKSCHKNLHGGKIIKTTMEPGLEPDDW